MRGGSMHGDIALSDAALSARSFFRLVNLGVPFPMNEYGEYVGYRTDHDATTRATSAGPLTSKYMTEALERSVMAKKIPMLDGYRVIKLLTENGCARGLLALCPSLVSDENPVGLCAMTAGSIVYAVGGPSAIYADTVYPESQTSSLGAAFEAGAAGANLTESQYGLASVDFRWNLSGTYQQVLPRYISTDAVGGDEREFLDGAFDSDEEMISEVFSKGYEWPFDPAKTIRGGSSRIDLAVSKERLAGRRVFLDYTRNPSCICRDGHFDSLCLPEKAADYLAKSDALLDTPIRRLEKMNRPAVELYAAHGIDLYREKLEIAVSAQHCNGGLAVKRSRESTTLRNFYAVGECAGTFGVYRPGGSALNSTQTGGLLAAMEIARRDVEIPQVTKALSNAVSKEYAGLLAMRGDMTRDEMLSRRRAYGRRMSACAAFLRNPRKIEHAMAECRAELTSFPQDYRIQDAHFLYEAYINRDILITQLVYLGAIRDYIADGGKSRGSYLVTDGDASSALSMAPELDVRHADFVQNTQLSEDGTVTSFFEPVRPFPESEQWFETVWNRYREENKRKNGGKSTVMKRILVVSSANMDFVQRMHRIPARGETVTEDLSYAYVPGGKGANSAVAFARLGTACVFCTCLGDDENGKVLRALYEKEGIDTSHIAISREVPTGLASIIVEEDGSNRIIVYPGANAVISEEDIRAAFDCRPDAVYVQLEISQDAVVYASKLACERGIPFIVDAGPARADFPLSALGAVEIFSPNETETRIFTGIEPVDEASRLAAAKRLYETVNTKYVVLKLGSAGAYLYDGKSGVTLPSYSVKVVDTTAAGDTFTAALVRFYLDGEPIGRAVALANCAASISVSRAGASASIPTIEETMAFAAARNV